MHEADEPNVGLDLAQAEALAGEDRGDDDQPAVQRPMAPEVVATTSRSCKGYSSSGRPVKGRGEGGVELRPVSIARASCGRSVLNSSVKASKRACCCEAVFPGGGAGRLLLQRQMHALVCGRSAGVWPGAMRSDGGDAEPEPPDREPREAVEGAASEGRTVVSADGGPAGRVPERAVKMP